MLVRACAFTTPDKKLGKSKKQRQRELGRRAYKEDALEELLAGPASETGERSDSAKKNMVGGGRV